MAYLQPSNNRGAREKAPEIRGELAKVKIMSWHPKSGSTKYRSRESARRSNASPRRNRETNEKPRVPVAILMAACRRAASLRIAFRAIIFCALHASVLVAAKPATKELSKRRGDTRRIIDYQNNEAGGMANALAFDAYRSSSCNRRRAEGGAHLRLARERGTAAAPAVAAAA